MATSQDFVNWVCSKQIDYRFLKYVLFAESDALLQFASGTTHQTIYFPEVKAFHVCLPPPDEQRQIVDLLGALDAKIELNRRMAETLEAMARALFRSWFVDFDPVRARAEGRPTGLPDDVAALFPDALDASGKPEKWKERILLDLCELKRGYDLPASQRSPGPYPIVSSSGISAYHASPMVQGPAVVTGRYGTIGHVFFVNGPCWPLNTSLYVRDFKGNSPRVVYYTLLGLDYQKYSDKAAVPGINRNHLHQAPMILPPRDVQDAFERLMTPVWKRQDSNEAQTATLSVLRDTLLPRLISGELRIRDAESKIEAA
jgi:type I restriction enzyme S subunit